MRKLSELILENDNKIGQIIFDQLGGNKFLAMTGAKNLAYNKKGLSIHLAKNKSKANILQINLEGNDSYTMIFSKLVKTDLVEIKKISDVYSSELCDIFTEITGMKTRL